MASKWNNTYLSGLVGLGLVGYNAVKSLIDAYEAEIIKDYAEFFPNLSIIDNGVIENQCVRIYKKDVDKKSYHFLNGPQPRTDELASMFLQKIITDIQNLNKDHKIELFISFGAFVTKNISQADFQDVQYESKDDLAEKILSAEISKKRNLYVATSGKLNFDDFVKDLDVDDVIIKETQGYISGLNGVLPAMIGERLKIPTATIMIETTGTDSRINNFPILAQFLGLLATKKALEFVKKVFGLEIDMENKIDNILKELHATAKQELINFFDRDYKDERNRESEYKNDKMYT
jgi:predicted ATP-grasp superfamily ATP-dependent carboligase